MSEIYLLQVSSNKRKQMGCTARFLEKCQTSMEKLTNDIREEKNVRLNIQKEILVEYKQIRRTYEDSLKKIEEELSIANKLRAERNKLLQELIFKNND